MQAFPVQVKPVWAKPAQEKPFLGKKPQRRGIWGGIWLGGHRADAVRTRPDRGVSRGDRGGVRECRGVVLVYNFLLEGKTYIRIRRAFHWQEPSDARIHVSQ